MHFLEYRDLSDLSGAEILKQRAINLYYESPSICKVCGVVIKIKSNQTPSAARKKKFCSYSCFYKSDDFSLSRGKGDPLGNCKCGKKFTKQGSIKCNDCWFYHYHFDVTIQSCLPKNEKWDAVRFTSARNRARRVATKVYKMIKHCRFCNSNEFDSVVELCHLKPICDFDYDTKLSVVNSRENLAYLCPSHHKLLDKGLIKINIEN